MPTGLAEAASTSMAVQIMLMEVAAMAAVPCSTRAPAAPSRNCSWNRLAFRRGGQSSQVADRVKLIGHELTVRNTDDDANVFRRAAEVGAMDGRRYPGISAA